MDYNKQARDFLEKSFSSVTLTFRAKSINEVWKEHELRNSYDVTIQTPLGKMSFVFWDSIENTRKQSIKAVNPSTYDVLACLTKYDPGTFEDFCSGYGYDEDSRTAERVYIDVIREYKQLCSIFTDEQMEELREIQ